MKRRDLLRLRLSWNASWKVCWGGVCAVDVVHCPRRGIARNNEHAKMRLTSLIEKPVWMVVAKMRLSLPRRVLVVVRRLARPCRSGRGEVGPGLGQGPRCDEQSSHDAVEALSSRMPLHCRPARSTCRPLKVIKNDEFVAIPGAKITYNCRQRNQYASITMRQRTSTPSLSLLLQ